MKRAIPSVALLVALTSVAYAGQSAAPAPAAKQSIVAEVRAAIAKGDFEGGERILKTFRAEQGDTPEAIEALSWLGRGALAAKLWNMADAYAKDAQDLSLSALKDRPLDAEPHLPLALGASIEVQAFVMERRDRRGDAVYFLNQALEKYGDTSIRTRIQKNINLLTLEGKPAPVLQAQEFLGTRAPNISDLKGKPVVLFFWAHWCPDCKMEAPILANLLAAYGDQGLTILAPTQRYGWVQRGQKASIEEENAYMAEIREKHYAGVDMAVPISAEDFKAYGASTTPTIVLVDRKGIVRLYHPGRMTQEELEPKVKDIL